MSKILNHVLKLEGIYLENEKVFLYCPNAQNYCPIPLLGIEKQTYGQGECSISIFKGDVKDFSSLEDFWARTILSGYIHEGCNWSEIVEDVGSYKDDFTKIDNNVFLKIYNSYREITSGYDYRISDLPEAKSSIIITEDICQSLCICTTKSYYYAFHFETSG